MYFYYYYTDMIYKMHTPCDFQALLLDEALKICVWEARKEYSAPTIAAVLLV